MTATTGFTYGRRTEVAVPANDALWQPEFASDAVFGHLSYTTAMGWPVEKILEEALKLDAEDRALIAAELSEPVEDPEEVRQAWVRLAVERLEKLERGDAKTVGWDEVQGRLQKILNR
jgi:hypothetical protein